MKYLFTFLQHIIHYKLFLDFATKHDTWMLSRFKTDDRWYDKIAEASKSEYLLKSLSLVKDGISDTECLVMSKNSLLDPEFSLSVGDCNKKHSAICRVLPQKINALTRPAKFPCMRDRGRRRKRSLDEESTQEIPKIKGL